MAGPPRQSLSHVGVSFALYARAKSDLAQKRDSAGLQHAGANTRQHVGAALPFKDDAIDAVSMKNMRQKQAGRTTADNRHLGSRCRFHRRLIVSV